eukprot:gnl/TRDRNA2_/TRDRNA2_57947_c0_seq1.p1 gnl/TRDRNA2_/TRDRNA2_57947_c0~~gnl/TRDRNA2_/TRDRNA2_57947_c0_seq1.p1  ORF type:complete len:182 (+),score=55.31 gnl/TRDRNA2_/TRDRNA2_57947_c0_seq1:63-608(+)
MARSYIAVLCLLMVGDAVRPIAEEESVMGAEEEETVLGIDEEYAAFDAAKGAFFKALNSDYSKWQGMLTLKEDGTIHGDKMPKEDAEKVKSAIEDLSAKWTDMKTKAKALRADLDAEATRLDAESKKQQAEAEKQREAATQLAKESGTLQKKRMEVKKLVQAANQRKNEFFLQEGKTDLDA